MKEKILLIEDTEDYRAYLRPLLSHYFDVDEAETLADGLAKLRDAPPELSYCAVLLDLSLPDSDWRTTFPAVAKSITPASIVIVSQHDDPDWVAQMIRWGAAGYVVKGKDDVEPAQLYQMIRTAVAHERIQVGLEGTERTAIEIRTDLKPPKP